MKKIWLGIAGVLLAAGLVFFAFAWREQTSAKEQAENFYYARQNASFDQEGEPEEVPVDFEKLREVNPDIYAWLTIPGTAIDAPVLQREGHVDYYLTHDWTGRENANGAICSESRYNGKDFGDAHTVLYGNNCGDGQLFGGLSAFEDETFFEQHPLMAVYTPDAVRYYRIFAAYEYDSRHLLQSFDSENPKVWKKYLDGIFTQRNLYAQIDEETVLEPEDRVLTLSTASSREGGQTYLVQGVLEKEFFR